MERMLSVEDKIRRAEEIYYRRKNEEIPVKENNKKNIKEKKNIKLLKKMIKQIVICLVIYFIFYGIINNNYIFSEDFVKKTKEILSQDIDISRIYSMVLNIIKKGHSVQESEKTKEEIQNNNENIGGAEDLQINEEANKVSSNEKKDEQIIVSEEQKLSQMEQDANYIKKTINFIKPVEGNVSSMYGLRNPSTVTVPKNHTGTDIAAVTGTKIYSATDGTVIYKSSKGDYGKHLKIQINDVIILYAHCNKLYVKEGDIIKQGQEIGEVGSTGNTTGPHLHFEVRYHERCIDPQLILEL